MFPAVLGLFIMLFYLAFFALAIAGLAFWVWMVVDVATREPNSGNDKVVWLLVVLLAGFIGALIYFFARKRPRDRAAAAAIKLAAPAA